MQLFIVSWPGRCACLLLIILLMNGCIAGTGEFERGAQALQNDQYDQAVIELMAAVEKNPDNYEYRLALINARDEASRFHKQLGDDYFGQKNYLFAQNEYQNALDMNSSNFVASSKLQESIRYAQAQQLTQEARSLGTSQKLHAKELLHDALIFVPDYAPATLLLDALEQNSSVIIDGMELEVISDHLVTLEFKETKLSEVFKILTKLSGINFILDADIRDTETSLHLEKATFAQAVELLLRLNKLDKKILNRKTIILYPKTPEKQKQFEDQLIQTFYLSNIDAKKAVNLLRTMLQLKKIYVHEELNAVVIRDTPTVVKLAADILAANDRSDAEVVFDLELIEVNHTDNRELGLKLSNYSITGGLGLPSEDVIASSALQAGDSTSGLIAGTDGFKALRPFYAIPTATFRLMKTQADSEVLANPRIRVRNKEEAKVHIGNREPVITVTINGDQTSENVQYVDVGVKLDIQPKIQLDNTVVTSLGLEVSNVSGRETTSNGTAVLTISTTNANTVLTLRDGEQTIIGGLIRGDKSTTKNKIPFFGDIPLFGELFNGADKTDIKREILLSITPHIVKSVQLPEPELAGIWSGGEDDLKYGRNFGTFAAEYTNAQKGNNDNAYPESDQDSLKSESTDPDRSSAAPTSQDGIEEAMDAGDGDVKQETAPVLSTQKENKTSTVFVQGKNTVSIDEVFTVRFIVSDIQDLASAPIYLAYNEDLFEFVGVSEGDFLKQQGQTTIFTHQVLDGKGQVVIGLKKKNDQQGSRGSGELLSVTFKAKQSGTGTIQPQRLHFRDSAGHNLDVNAVGLNVQVE